MRVFFFVLRRLGLNTMLSRSTYVSVIRGLFQKVFGHRNPEMTTFSALAYDFDEDEASLSDSPTTFLALSIGKIIVKSQYPSTIAVQS